MIDAIPRQRIKWSEFPYYSPIRIIIKDWKNLKVYMRQYLLIDSEMEYKERKIELCVPYHVFVRKIIKLPVEWQKLIISNNAIIEIEKTYKFEDHGMRINNVEPLKSDDKIQNEGSFVK